MPSCPYPQVATAASQAAGAAPSFDVDDYDTAGCGAVLSANPTNIPQSKWGSPSTWPQSLAAKSASIPAPPAGTRMKSVLGSLALARRAKAEFAVPLGADLYGEAFPPGAIVG